MWRINWSVLEREKTKALFAIILLGGTLLLLIAAALWGVNGILTHHDGSINICG
jgi:hypothetical protein